MKYTFSQIANEIIELQARKNADYGDSYIEDLEDENNLGPARYALGNKYRRFKHLSIEEIAQVDEKLEDTLMDMAAYAIMTVQWMREHEN